MGLEEVRFSSRRVSPRREVLSFDHVSVWLVVWHWE